MIITETTTLAELEQLFQAHSLMCTTCIEGDSMIAVVVTGIDGFSGHARGSRLAEAMRCAVANYLVESAPGGVTRSLSRVRL